MRKLIGVIVAALCNVVAFTINNDYIGNYSVGYPGIERFYLMDSLETESINTLNVYDNYNRLTIRIDSITEECPFKEMRAEAIESRNCDYLGYLYTEYTEESNGIGDSILRFAYVRNYDPQTGRLLREGWMTNPDLVFDLIGKELGRWKYYFWRLDKNSGGEICDVIEKDFGSENLHFYLNTDSLINFISDLAIEYDTKHLQFELERYNRILNKLRAQPRFAHYAEKIDSMTMVKRTNK